MDFLNKIGNVASETYKKTSKKTGEFAKEAKMKMQMNENKGKINDLYQKIGKIVYQQYVKNEILSLNEDLNSYCTQIDELSSEIEKALEKLLALKGKRICENCHSEIDINVKFCPFCGKEQSKIVEEVEENAEEKEKFNDDAQVKEAQVVEEDNNINKE